MAQQRRLQQPDMPPAGDVSGTGGSPLLDVDDLEPPRWAEVDRQVAAAGMWQTLVALPAAVALVTRLAFSVAPRLTVVAGMVQLASGCASAFGLYSTANVFTTLLSTGPTPQRLLASLPAVVLVVSSFALRGLLNAAVEAVRGRLTPWVRHAAHAEVATALAGVDLLAWEDADFRELARQGGQKGAAAVETSLRGIAEISSSCVSLMAALITAGMLSLWPVPVLLLSSAADAVVSMWIAKLGYRHFLAMVARNMRLHVVENLLVARDVALERHALTLQQPLLREQHRISADLAQETIRSERRKTRVRLFGQVLSAVGTGLSYLVLALLLYLGAMPLAIAGAAVVAMRTASSALGTTMTSANRLYEDSFYLHFYQELIRQARQKHPRPSTITAPRHPQTIRLENVWFTYPDQTEPALRGITLTLHRGEVVALVGQNGSGKSTLGKLITGLYPPSQGAVRWDEVDLATADRHSIHDRIAVIAQEPARWPMTAAVNVRVGRPEYHDPDQRAWQAALSASGADEVLHSLPRGENTVLSRQFKEGVELSGGQWQRLAVARGGFRNAPVLLADEPTAALDAVAEAHVFAGLQHAAQNVEPHTSSNGDRPQRTVILVTHRLANVRSADRILVLDQGKIIESGTHDELMSADTQYRKLFEIQADPYRTERSYVE
jgi:ATP-binding cassette subfamily B protein